MEGSGQTHELRVSGLWGLMGRYPLQVTVILSAVMILAGQGAYLHRERVIYQVLPILEKCNQCPLADLADALGPWTASARRPTGADKPHVFRFSKHLRLHVAATVDDSARVLEARLVYFYSEVVTRENIASVPAGFFPPIAVVAISLPLILVLPPLERRIRGLQHPWKRNLGRFSLLVICCLPLPILWFAALVTFMHLVI